MSFTDVFFAIILGIVEGLTEWLPISSTGHILVTEEVFGFMVDNSANSLTFSEAFMEMFDVVIQLGAICAVVIIFFKKLWPFGFKPTAVDENKYYFIEPNTTLTIKDKWILWGKVLLACVPAGVVGVLLNDYIDQIFFNPLTISITLIIYGIFFLVIEIVLKNKKFTTTDIKELSIRNAVIIGVIQVLALIPGTSRSGVTILGALLLACDRTVAAEFSFFLSIPIMFGASLFKIYKFMQVTTFSNAQVALLIIGVVTAFAVSLLGVKLLLRFIKRFTYKGFGYYRVAFGIIILICILSGLLKAF